MPSLSRPVGTGRGAEAAGGSCSRGDLAIVLHSHMPYVEGFGTYPFGEEWLFDAISRSYLPVLDVAEGITVTVTPVLADQLEAPGVADRLAAFLDRVAGVPPRRIWRRDAAARVRLGLRGGKPVRGRALRAGAGSTRRISAASSAAFPGRPRMAGSDALAASSATHAVLPLLATRQGLGLQLDAGIRSHRRRFGWDGGFWLPECAYAPGLEWSLAEHGVRWFCVDQSAHEGPLDALAPVATSAGPVALPIDWEAVSWLWSLDGYPVRTPPTPSSTGKSLRGTALGDRGWRLRPDARRGGAARQADEFLAGVAERLERFAGERQRSGLMVFAIDTELLGHWWWEGPTWLREVVARASDHGVEMVTLSQALARHEPEERTLAPSTWGEAKDLRTWDSPAVADLAWGARRLELRLLRALSPTAWAVVQPSARRGSCWRCRPATGPSSIAAGRRATTRTSVPPTTLGQCSRP